MNPRTASKWLFSQLGTNHAPRWGDKDVNRINERWL